MSDIGLLFGIGEDVEETWRLELAADTLIHLRHPANQPEHDKSTGYAPVKVQLEIAPLDGPQLILDVKQESVPV